MDSTQLDRESTLAGPNGFTIRVKTSFRLLARGGAFTVRHRDDFQGEIQNGGDLATCRSFRSGASFRGVVTYLPPEDATGARSREG